LEVNNYTQTELNSNEIRVETTRGTGNGGQHRNTTDSCVVMTHIPTGIKVVVDGRNQHNNKRNALKELTDRVNRLYEIGHNTSGYESKKEQLSDASRGDKRRTYKVTESVVIDHITGKRARLKDVQRGKIELLK
jgi:peptide chain release factor 1